MNNDKSTTQGRKELEKRATQKYRHKSLQEDDPFGKMDNEPSPDTATKSLHADNVDGSENSFQDLENQIETNPKVTATSADKESTSDKVTFIVNNPIYDCFGVSEDFDTEAKDENNFLNLITKTENLKISSTMQNCFL